MSDPGRLKLGELLVRRGLVDRAQLLAALTSQHSSPTRLGSLLVEQGHLKVDELAEMLAMQTGYPAANSADFQQIDRESVEVVPQRFCIRHNVLPLKMDANVLHLAATDPQKQAVFDELSASLGLHILPHIAPQGLLRHHIQRFHAAAVLANAADARKAARSKPVGRETMADLSEEAPLPDSPIRHRARPEPPPSPVAASVPESLDLVFLDEVTGQDPWADDDWDLEIDDSDIAAFDASDLDIDISIETFDGEPAKPSDVLTRLRSATHRDAVVECLLQPVIPGTTMMVLLVPRGDVAGGLAAWGSELSADQVRALVVPLKTPSLISAALEQRTVQIGEAAGDTVQAMISSYLRTPDAHVSYVVPVHIGERVINLVYAQATVSPEESAMESVTRVAAHAAEAYRRMIRQKRGRK